MKTVLFDLLYSQPEGGIKYHGGGEYIKRIFRELALNYLDRIELIVYYDHSAFLDDWVKEIIREKDIEVLDIKKPADITQVLKERDIDVFYTGMCYQYNKAMFTDEVYTIGTFHGMRGAECPHDEFEYKYMSGKQQYKEMLRWYLKNTKRYGYVKAAENAVEGFMSCISSFDKLICDSEHTAFSLKNYYPELDTESIDIIYPPLKYSESIYPGHLKEKFLLAIGGNRWVKNTYRALKALDDLYSRGHLKGVKSVIVGSVPASIIKEIKCRDNFRFVGYIEDDKLAALYRDCEAFIYPTLNEGFGYPPLEAMRFGTTCIVSAVCSLPEICGEAVYFVNPLDVGEIQNRILHAIDRKLDSEKVKNQFERIKRRQETDLEKLCMYICTGRP